MSDSADIPKEKLDESLILEIIKRADDELNKQTPPSVREKKLSDFYIEQQLSNQEFRRQVVSYRKGTFWLLVILMTAETLALYSIIILASLPSKILLIGDTTLQILVGATIAQTSLMMIVIIKSVYSDSLNKLIMSDRNYFER